MRTFMNRDGSTYSYLDEEDLANCRCGGKAQFKYHGNQTYQVRCAKCSIQTSKRTDSQSVMRQWNTVMGGVLPNED